LQNIIERPVIVSESGHFSIDESWLSRRSSEKRIEEAIRIFQKRAAHEKEMIESVLRETKGRVFGPSGAAVKLGMPGTPWTPKSGRSRSTRIASKFPSPRRASCTQE
jgi:transcriptional regulator with PAS, ATPase and Fis domain